MTETQAREEICRVGKSLFDRGYVHAAAGNISVRLEDADGGGFLISPTDACLGFLDPARLARLDANAQQLSGDKASKTMALHAHIYAAATRFDTATRCIIHTHSTYSVALSLQQADQSSDAQAQPHELLLPLTPYFVMKVGHVPLMPYHRPGDPAVAALVVRTIADYGARGTPIRAVMLARLGPAVWHDSPMQAMATLEELEETARLSQLEPAGHGQPVPSALTAMQIEALRQNFGARW
jgi:ribulose-5-phosphate 4-epimerase/fuculose-1-phosphate aldolase